jgi:7-cyano-7-deazaguanine synthase
VVDLSVFSGLVVGGSALTDPAIAVPDLRDIRVTDRRQPVTYVPNRNLVLLSLAAAYAEARGIRDVFYGSQAQDEYGYWDCSRDFVIHLNKLLSLNRKKSIRVFAPFVGMRKMDVLAEGLRLGVDFSRTWTCYRGGTRSCGSCPSCVERGRAFREAGLPDPLVGKIRRKG